MIELLSLGLSLTMIVCFIIVVVNMVKEGNLLLAIFSVLCCQIVVFVWGWGWWKSEKSNLVMGIWTLCFLAQVGLYAMYPDVFEQLG